MAHRKQICSLLNDRFRAELNRAELYRSCSVRDALEIKSRDRRLIGAATIIVLKKGCQAFMIMNMANRYTAEYMVQITTYESRWGRSRVKNKHKTKNCINDYRKCIQDRCIPILKSDHANDAGKHDVLLVSMPAVNIHFQALKKVPKT